MKTLKILTWGCMAAPIAIALALGVKISNKVADWICDHPWSPL